MMGPNSEKPPGGLPENAYKTGEVCPVCGEEIWAVRVCGCVEFKKPCRCKNAQALAYDQRQKALRERREYQARLAQAGIPARFLGCTLQGFERRPGTEEALQLAAQWLGKLEENLQSGRGLLFSGPTGTGKTHLGAAILNQCLRSGYDGAYWNVADCLERLLPGHAPEKEQAALLKRACCRPVLLLDDLGVEKPSDWTQKQLTVLLDSRYRDKRPTIITTNCRPQEMLAHIGERAFSRLMEVSTVGVLTAGDYRRPQARLGPG